MEIKILNSILFKELMPWTFDAKGTKAINEKIKKVGSTKPTTEAELVQQLQILLADYSDLSKWLTKQNTKGTSTLKNHCYAIDFPAYSDAVSKFYNAVISLETLRVYNAFNAKMQKYSKKVDIVYHTTIALKNIKALTVNTVKEIKERGFEEAPTEQSSLPHFVLQLLRQHLTILFFDIQELSKASIDSPTSIEDFYLLDLNLPKAQIPELKLLTPANIDFKGQEVLNFGFKDDFEKLKSVVIQLCHQVEFLNEDVTSADELLKVFISKSILPNSVKIQIGCETKNFRYIVNKFKPYFHNLTLANIEKSQLFYSKSDNLITANNLSASNNKNAVEPKEKATIDKIFKQMQ
jgi:hypothetical protein